MPIQFNPSSVNPSPTLQPEHEATRRDFETLAAILRDAPRYESSLATFDGSALGIDQEAQLGHGLGEPPSHVSVTPNFRGAVWVDLVTSTSVRIHVRIDAMGAGLVARVGVGLFS